MSKLKKLTSESNKVTRMTFDVPADLKKSFKLKITSEDMDIKEALCKLMKAYVDGKINLN
jgi:DNA-directed RNA polymerase subunit L